MNIGLVDLLDIEQAVLKSKNSNFAFYTGLATMDIPKGVVFKYLYDSLKPDDKITGEFVIESIFVLTKPSDYIPKGYQGVIFVSSNITLESIKENIEFNAEGNFENVCILSS